MIYDTLQHVDPHVIVLHLQISCVGYDRANPDPDDEYMLFNEPSEESLRRHRELLEFVAQLSIEDVAREIVVGVLPNLRSVFFQIGVKGSAARSSWYTVTDEDGSTELQEVSEDRALSVLDSVA